jgi:hypothetical protein
MAGLRFAIRGWVRGVSYPDLAPQQIDVIGPVFVAFAYARGAALS